MASSRLTQLPSGTPLRDGHLSVPVHGGTVNHAEQGDGINHQTPSGLSGSVNQTVSYKGWLPRSPPFTARLPPEAAVGP